VRKPVSCGQVRETDRKLSSVAADRSSANDPRTLTAVKVGTAPCAQHSIVAGSGSDSDTRIHDGQ